MTRREAAWIRQYAWPTSLRHRFTTRPDCCSCTWGVCNNCTRGLHRDCVTGDGHSAADAFVCSVLSHGGDRVAVVVHLPRQRPCRLLCPCQHPMHTHRPGAVAPVQLGLFDEAVPR